MVCCNCNIREVPPIRAEHGLVTCMHCAEQVKPVKGYMSWQHKTAPTIQLVNADEFKDFRRYQPYGRNTGRGSGVHRMIQRS